MRKLIALVIINVLLLGGLAFATTYYVDASTTEGNVVGDGTSEATAWQTITYALTQVSGGDTINVATGEYTSSMNGSSESFPISIAAGITLTGSGSATTIIDGGDAHNDKMQLAANVTLEGFTIKGFSSSGSYFGLRINGSGVDINNCVIDGEGTGRMGIYFDGVSGGNTAGGSVSSCEVKDFTSTAIVVNGTNSTGVTIQYCTIETITYYGINIDSAWDTTVNITGNNIIYAGTSSGSSYSSGIYAEAGSSTVTIDQNTFARYPYRGIYMSNGTVTVINNIFSNAPYPNDIPTARCYGIYQTGGSLTNDYNSFYNNWYDRGGTSNPPAGSNSITDCPEFYDPWNDDYDLYTGSPCINAGSSEGTTVNIGAYQATGEGTSPYLTTSYVDPTGTNSIASPGTNGTIGSPWRTITYANKYTITKMNVAAGTYNAATGESFPIESASGRWFSGAGVGSSTIEGAGGDSYIFSLYKNTTVEGFFMKTWNSAGVYVRGSGAEIKNNIFDGTTSGWYGINFDGTGSGSSAGGIVSSCEVNNLYTGINIDGSNSSDVTIEGTTIYNIDYYGIDVDTDEYVEIKNNNIIYAGFSGGSQYSSGIFYNPPGSVNNLIEQNTFARCPQRAIYMASGTVTLKNNIFSNAPYTNGVPFANSYGIYQTGGTLTNDYNNVWNNSYDYGGASGPSAGGNSKSVCPEIVDPWNYDFDLYVGSPCLGSGEGGVNMGSYQGTGEANSPYLATSYVNNSTGSDEVTGGWGTEEARPWKTITHANKYTTYKMNVAAGTYNAAAGESFDIESAQDRWFSGVGSESATVEGSDAQVFYVFKNVTIEGFTVKGMGTSNGIAVDGSGADIKNNLIYGANLGTGIYFYGGSGQFGGGTVATCEVRDLWYGVKLSGANVAASTILGNTINNAIYSGISATSVSSLTVKKNLIIDNGNSGGTSRPSGIYCLNSTIQVDRNTIVKCPKKGIWVEGGTLTSTNNIISDKPDGSSPTAGSYGIYLTGGAATSTYDDVWNNETNWDSDVTPVTTGTGTISADPQFLDVAGSDYHLEYNSPCINSGDPTTEKDPDGTTADMGCYPFDLSISGTMAVYLISPQDGDIITGYSTTEITWYASKEGAPALSIDLDYSVNSGSTWTDITTEANDGSYIWTVPNIGTTSARVKVTAIGSAATDESDSDFTIQGATLLVTVETPDGGETWAAGTWNNITWETNVTCDSINLYYSINGGSSYNTITTGQTDDGSYSWLVPNNATTEAKVRVVGYKDSDVATDESNAVFTITSASDFYVDVSTGSNSYNGLTSEVDGSNGPWKNISYAATQAASGNTVHVTGAGTYNSSAGETFPISIPGNVQLISDVSPSIAATVDAESEIRVFTLNASSSLDGFTIKNNGSSGSNGAVYLASTNGNILNNTITCSASSAFAVYGTGASDSSEIRNNNIWVASSGRGIKFWVDGYCTDLIVSGNTIEAGSNGYGMDMVYISGYLLTNNWIKGAGSGYGISFSNSSSGSISSNEVRSFQYGIFSSPWGGGAVDIYNNTILNNTDYGIYCTEGIGSGTTNTKNNIICGNTQLGSFTTGNYGLYGYSGYTPASSYNNIWNNATNWDSDVPTGAGDISSYPRFINPESNDYRIGTDSPCATGGDPSYMGRYAPSGTSSFTGESWVDAVNGNDSSGDGSQGSPWKTITRASTQTVDVIHAEAGTYDSAVNGESFPFTLAEDQYLKSEASPTTLATLGAGSEIRIVGLGPDTTLEGFTIKTSGTNASNGAIYLLDTAYVLSNTMICTGLSANGVYVAGAANDSQIKNNDIGMSNTGTKGIYVKDADNVLAQGNTVEVSGGAVSNGGIYYSGYCDGLTITDNLVKGAGTQIGIYATTWSNATVCTNEVRGFEYGIYSYPAGSITLDIYNNTIVNCTEYGIYCYYWLGSPTTNIKNNIISCDTQLGSFTTGTYGIYGYSGYTPTSSYNNVWNNATNWDSDVPTGTGDISSYPRFITGEGLYKIGSDSPCATGGDPSYMGRYSPSGSSGILAESWVDDDGDDTTGTGTSSATAWETIGKGLALTDGTVHLMAGTFNAANGDTFPYTLAEDQVVDSVATPTSLATVDAAGSSPRVFGLGPYTTVEGFTIKTAAANPSNGAIYLFNKSTSVLSNNITCSASSANAIYGLDAADDAQIKNNDIWVASSGYGMFFDDYCDNGVIDGNTIEVGSSGYGINFDRINTGYTVSNNLIKGSGGGRGILCDTWTLNGDISTNEVRNFEYGIYWYGNGYGNCTAYIYKNTLVKNDTGIYGTHREANYYLYIRDNIIASEVGGHVKTGSVGIRGSSSRTDSTYNCLYANDTTYEGTVDDKTQDLEKNPEFVDANNDDYHLTYNSHCIASASDGTDRGRYDYSHFDMALYVKEPDGGESLTGLNTSEVTWYANYGDNILTIDLAYSTDDGATYTQFATGETNDGSYDWTVANVETTEAKMKVTTSTPATTDESDSVFTISSVDVTGPTVTVESPTTGAEKWKGGSTQNITFTVTDESGILANSLTIWYSTDSGGDYPNVVTQDAAVSSPYVWTVPTISTSAARVRVELKDNSPQQNAGTDESGANFIIDSTGPSAPTLVTPLNGTSTNDVTPFMSWEAAVDVLVTVVSYEVKIDATLITQDATTNYTPGTPLSETVHTWQVKAKDEVGNWGSYSTAFTFEVDVIGPNVTSIEARDPVTGNTSYTNTREVTIEAFNVTGTPETMIMSENSDFSGASWISYVNPTTFTLSSGEGTKTIYYKLRDLAYNQSATVSASIIYDISGPTVASIILSDQSSGSTTYTNSLTVSLDAVSVTGSPNEMIIAESSIFAGAIWVTYQDPTTFTVNSGDGVKTVYYKVRDYALNESTPVNDSITLDTRAPTTPEGLSPADGSTVTETQPTFSWEASSDGRGSGVGGYEVIINSSTIIATVTATSYTPTVDLAGGAHTWQVRAYDNAGNWSSTASASFNVATEDIAVISLNFDMTPTGVKADSQIVVDFSVEMNESSVEQNFSVNAPQALVAQGVKAQVTGTTTWSADGKTMFFTPDNLAEGTTYTINISSAAQSASGDSMQAFAYSFKTQTSGADASSPLIAIEIDSAVLSNDDYVAKRPTFEVTLTDDISLDATTLTVVFNSVNVLSQITTTLSSATKIEFTYQPSSDLADERTAAHTIEVTVKDAVGNSTTKTIQNLKVAAPQEAAEVVEGEVTPVNEETGQPTFSPSQNEKMVISYSLNKDASVRVYIFGPTGGVVWNRAFAAGTEGGKVGLNQVEFNGVSDITGSPLGNGIYVGRVIVNGKTGPKFYIVIYEQ